MHTYHEFDHGGKHYRLVYDDEYSPDKCCGGAVAGRHEGDAIGAYCAKDRPGGGGAGEDECERWWNIERAKLESGEWVALGCIVTSPCAGSSHCEGCQGSTEDSLWGIVIENTLDAAEKIAKGVTRRGIVPQKPFVPDPGEDIDPS